MMRDGASRPFSDDSLKQALVREAARTSVEPSLHASVASLFAQEPAPIPIRPPIRRGRVLFLAAATIVAGLSLAFFTLRSGNEPASEYTIAEARLWPAMASLYHSDAFEASPATRSALTADDTSLNDPRYHLLSVRSDKIETVPCTVSDYRRDDGATFSVISARAADLLREPEEESDERYDQTSGAIRIVGGIRAERWICIAAPLGTPADLFTDVLNHLAIAAK